MTQKWKRLFVEVKHPQIQERRRRGARQCWLVLIPVVGAPSSNPVRGYLYHTSCVFWYFLSYFQTLIVEKFVSDFEGILSPDHAAKGSPDRFLAMDHKNFRPASRKIRSSEAHIWGRCAFVTA